MRVSKNGRREKGKIRKIRSALFHCSRKAEACNLQQPIDMNLDREVLIHLMCKSVIQTRLVPPHPPSRKPGCNSLMAMRLENWKPDYETVKSFFIVYSLVISSISLHSALPWCESEAEHWSSSIPSDQNNSFQKIGLVLLEFHKASVSILPIEFHVFHVLAGVFITTRTWTLLGLIDLAAEFSCSAQQTLDTNGISLHHHAAALAN